MPKARCADRGPKKKSIKARAVLSSKRKLSRFGKKGKAGLRGAAALYLSRARAVARLQVSLKDFRRLCILKGIYPREPASRRAGDTQTYFHVKDVQYLQHEPLLAKFREFKVRGGRTHALALAARARACPRARARVCMYVRVCACVPAPCDEAIVFTPRTRPRRLGGRAASQHDDTPHLFSRRSSEGMPGLCLRVCAAASACLLACLRACACACGGPREQARTRCIVLCARALFSQGR